MKNKITAFIFILIANIVLLVHFVIPHHHHQKQVCVESKHCKNDAIAHNQEAAKQEHQHDDKNSSNCGLKQVDVLPPNHGKQVKISVESKGYHSQDFQFILKNSLSITHISVNGIIALNPRIIPLYSIFVSSSLSLRGPPAV